MTHHESGNAVVKLCGRLDSYVLSVMGRCPGDYTWADEERDLGDKVKRKDTI